MLKICIARWKKKTHYYENAYGVNGLGKIATYGKLRLFSSPVHRENQVLPINWTKCSLLWCKLGNSGAKGSSWRPGAGLFLQLQPEPAGLGSPELRGGWICFCFVVMVSARKAVFHLQSWKRGTGEGSNFFCFLFSLVCWSSLPVE